MYSFLTSALDEVDGQCHTPATSPSGKRAGTHCVAVLVGPRAGLYGCEKSRPPPGFDSRIVQPVVSRYTDYALTAQGTQRMCIVGTFSDSLVYYGPLDNNIPPVYEGSLSTERLYNKISTLASTVQFSSV
jgi:hypothetical protein